jgi:DNA-binding NarL/FixJ family response regulator
MPSESRDRIKVFVVDDHAVVRRGLRAFFESEPDLEVVGAADGGTQALDLLEELEAQGRRPDVIVMDLQMRPLNGIESTRLIRARYDDVAVVVLTSYADDELVRGAVEAGASGYVLKDADTDQVAAAVRAADRGDCSRHSARLRVARPRRSSPRARSRSCGWWGRARRTRRSPSSSASANGRLAPTCPTSWPSWVSHHARKPLCGPCARAWCRWTPADVARAFHPVRAMLRAQAVPTIERCSGSLRVRGQ